MQAIGEHFGALEIAERLSRQDIDALSAYGRVHESGTVILVRVRIYKRRAGQLQKYQASGRIPVQIENAAQPKTAIASQRTRMLHGLTHHKPCNVGPGRFADTG